MTILRVKEIKEFESIFDFDPKEKKYRDFLAARKTVQETGSWGLEKATEKIFEEFIKEYIRKIDMWVKHAYLKKGKEIEVSCYGTKIIPGRETHGDEEACLDGYAPRIIFNANNENLRATSSLKRKGNFKLSVLEDILKLAKTDGDGIKKPKIAFREENIVIASIEQIPAVLKALKRIYENIGDNRLEQLFNLRSTFNNMAQDDFNKYKDEGRKILKQEYSKRLEWCTPENIF